MVTAHLIALETTDQIWLKSVYPFIMNISILMDIQKFTVIHYIRLNCGHHFDDYWVLLASFDSIKCWIWIIHKFENQTSHYLDQLYINQFLQTSTFKWEISNDSKIWHWKAKLTLLWILHFEFDKYLKVWLNQVNPWKRILTETGFSLQYTWIEFI